MSRLALFAFAMCFAMTSAQQDKVADEAPEDNWAGDTTAPDTTAPETPTPPTQAPEVDATGLCFLPSDSECPGRVDCHVSDTFAASITTATARDLSLAESEVAVGKLCTKSSACEEGACILTIDVPHAAALALSSCRTSPSECDGLTGAGLRAAAMTPSPEGDDDFPWWVIVLIASGALLLLAALGACAYYAYGSGSKQDPTYDDVFGALSGENTSAFRTADDDVSRFYGTTNESPAASSPAASYPAVKALPGPSALPVGQARAIDFGAHGNLMRQSI